MNMFRNNVSTCAGACPAHPLHDAYAVPSSTKVVRECHNRETTAFCSQGCFGDSLVALSGHTMGGWGHWRFVAPSA